MTSVCRFSGISVLIPGYSVEDIPTDLSEEKATGLLNAIACAWHPAVIEAAEGVPQFRYADLSEIMDSGQILMLPECSGDWLGHDWQMQLESGNCCVLHSLTERRDWLNAIEHELTTPDDNPVEPSLVDEFLALGLSWYLVMALSRRMHHYIDPDETRLSSAIHDAAAAAIGGCADQALKSLHAGFECILETREQLFPVESYMLDICLNAAPGDEQQLLALIKDTDRVNLLISGAELNDLRENHCDIYEAVSGAAAAGTCCIVSGGWHELRSGLSSLSAAYAELQRTEKTHPQSARIWGQRRFGLLHSLPGLLRLFDYDFALHLALDDGVYPEREQNTFYWQDSGSASVKSSSRLPVAIDSASSFLRLPERLAEAMQYDSPAVVLLARLPESKTPWFSDLKRIHERCPVIGRFATFGELPEQMDHSGDPVRFAAGEYLGPHLIQSSVLKTEAPISGPADLHCSRHQLEQLAFLQSLNRILNPESADSSVVPQLESELQEAEHVRLTGESPGNPDKQRKHTQQINRRICEHLTNQVEQLGSFLPAGDAAGRLIVNPLPFGREATIRWPSGNSLPEASENLLAAYQQDDDIFLRVKVPAGGGVQFAEAESRSASVHVEKSTRRPLAEDGILRNQYFEAILSSTTGGIADVRFHGQRANRVSQLVAFRYESAKTIPATETTDQITTSYARTLCEKMTVASNGPWFGAIESHCVIRDALDERLLFRFRQIMRVERTVPRIEISIIPELVAEHPVTGNPWMTYLACRFAWDNEAAAISRSLLGQTCGFQGERFESPDYIEVADYDQRLLIIPHGRPYHRRSGPRMLDSILLVEGQPVPTNGFQFTLEFDQLFPQRSVIDVLQPVISHSVANIRSSAGWILACSARNIQVARIRADGRSVVVVLQETEGRSSRCRLRTARKPESACVRKATGSLIERLDIHDCEVEMNFSPFELKEVQLSF
ncbi:MAG: hypothetical protein MK102_01790 [Fuerstiella sp.]|nr:hypothetical protein [Fuerstiella sp.]